MQKLPVSARSCRPIRRVPWQALERSSLLIDRKDPSRSHMSRLSRLGSVTYVREPSESRRRNLESVQYHPFRKEALHNAIAVRYVTRRGKVFLYHMEMNEQLIVAKKLL